MSTDKKLQNDIIRAQILKNVVWVKPGESPGELFCKKSLVDVIQPFNDIDELLTQLAHFCISHNLYRQGNAFYYFKCDEVRRMNKCCLITGLEIDSGYMFLDDPNGKEGMIRINAGDANPKWIFIEENDEIKFDWA